MWLSYQILLSCMFCQNALRKGLPVSCISTNLTVLAAEANIYIHSDYYQKSNLIFYSLRFCLLLCCQLLSLPVTSSSASHTLCWSEHHRHSTASAVGSLHFTSKGASLLLHKAPPNASLKLSLSVTHKEYLSYLGYWWAKTKQNQSCRPPLFYYLFVLSFLSVCHLQYISADECRVVVWDGDYISNYNTNKKLIFAAWDEIHMHLYYFSCHNTGFGRNLNVCSCSACAITCSVLITSTVSTQLQQQLCTSTWKSWV